VNQSELMSQTVRTTGDLTASAVAPLVSIGVPVRNGAATLALALDSLLAQTYPHLEIIISDNNSSDGTGDIARQYADRDPRVRYFRQERMLTLINNFRFAFEQARGEYFMWAAHDDLRSPNFAEVLVERLEREPNAALAFSDVTEFNDYSTCRERPILQHAFATGGLSIWQKIEQQTHYGCMHIFGVFKAGYLRDYDWADIESGSDVIMLMTIGTLAEFVYQPGAMFYYFRPPDRSHEQRAKESRPNSTGLRPLHAERLAWQAAAGVAQASRKMGRRPSRLILFLYLYYQMTQGIKGIIFRWTPHFVRRAWRQFKPAATEANFSSPGTDEQ
jgi:glycosyltransferase involved in cell wall biosynthesis